MSYTSQQVLKYIKRIHKKGFSLDHTVQNHAEWELENIPVADLKIASDEDPYNRVLDLDYDHVDTISKQDILSHAIVADQDGHIIDGNHRAAKAQALGMKFIPAFVPVVDTDNETYDQFMARRQVGEITTVPTVAKGKREHLDVMPNDGKPIPAGQEKHYLGQQIGNLDSVEVWQYNQGSMRTFVVFDPKRRISQLAVTGSSYPGNPNSFIIKGVYSGPKNQTRAADLYAWLVQNQMLTLVSDIKQSEGGYRVWQELESRYGRKINIHGFNTKTNKPINVSTDDEADTHVDQEHLTGAGRDIKDIARNIRLVASPVNESNLNETTMPGEYVYHASNLPNQQQGLKSVLMSGLRPSSDGYAGPGVYFAYDPDGGYYHVSKEEATLFRAKWSDLVSKFGTYPTNPNGIERDDNEIIVPGHVPASMLEVEYFPDEWWDIASAYEASKGPISEAVIDNIKGAGAVPYNADVDYFGLRVKMKPSTFLKLAAPLGREHDAELEKYIANGGAIGAPFLDIAVPPEWDENDFSKSAQIKGHEGRNRMTAILKLEGDKPIETHLFVKYYRNRDLTPEFIDKLNSGLYAEKSTHLIGGPLFSVGAVTESVSIAPTDNNVKKFISAMYDKYPTWPMNSNQRAMVWGAGEDQQFAVFELKPSLSKKNSVEVAWFQAYPLRQGVGSRAMKELQAQAKEAGVGLTLYPWDKGQVSQAKLTKFYKQQGFKPTQKGGKALAWETIAEAFDQPYPITWEEGDFDSRDALARLDDGSNLSINFNLESGGPEGMDEEWHVEFWRNNSLAVTGEGDAYRIFATVMVAIQQFIKEENPERISFSASKEVDDGQNSESRAKLYDRLVQRYAKSWGYKSSRADRGDVVVYELVRLGRVNEGGWASTATQNTVITPHVIEEAIGILNQFAEEFNAWQASQGLDVEIKMGKPVGSGTYYQRDLQQDPSREYGDVDVVCYIHSREGVGASKRTSEYAEAVKQFAEHNSKYSTSNGTNVIMDTSAGPIQVDLIFTYNEHANWARALAPEYRVKGVISTSLMSSLAEVLNMSFGLQGVQVKTRAGRPVSFRQSKDTELHTVSIDPEMWASDMFTYYYQLQNGKKPDSIPANLQTNSGLKDEQRLSDIVLAIKALATDMQSNNLLGTGALDYITDKSSMMKQIAQVYSKKLDAVINSSKFDKAETPAAIEKASKTKLMLAKYRNEITKLLLN